jgi:hypothetical protein
MKIDIDNMDGRTQERVALCIIVSLLAVLAFVIFIAYLVQDKNEVKNKMPSCYGMGVRNVSVETDYKYARRGRAWYLKKTDVKRIELYDGRIFEISSDDRHYDRYTYISSGDILNEKCANDLSLDR